MLPRHPYIYSFEKEKPSNIYNKLVLPPIEKENLAFSLRQAQCKLSYITKKRICIITKEKQKVDGGSPKILNKTYVQQE